MVLDGVMVLIATICMTVMHPGYAFGKHWNDASFPFRTPKVPIEGEGSESAAARDSNSLSKKLPILKSVFPNVFGEKNNVAEENSG